MNTAQVKQTKMIIQLHSAIDLITNSSTEIFCVVDGKSEEVVKEMLDAILDEFGCTMCGGDYGLSVYTHDYDWIDGEEVKAPEGQFEINYEQHAPPCKMIIKKIEETFNVIKMYD